MFAASKVKDLSLSILTSILSKPLTLWIGLIESEIFGLCSKTSHVDDLNPHNCKCSILGDILQMPLLLLDENLLDCYLEAY